MKNLKPNRTFLLILLSAGVLFQVWALLPIIRQDFRAVRADIGQSALWRSANFYQGQKFANFVRFLVERIPEEARVVLPPLGSGPPIIATTPLMQYYLAPRQVINCTDIACLQNLSLENTYVVVVTAEQAAAVDQSLGNLVQFDGSWGIITPPQPKTGHPQAVAAFNRLVEVFWAAGWPGLWFGLITVSGAMFSRALLPDWPAIARLAVGYAVGLSAFSLSVALAALSGFALQRRLVISVSLLLALAGLLVYLHSRRYSPRLPGDPHTSKMPSFDLWQLAFLVLAFSAMLISVGKSYHSTDGLLLWGAKGYGIAATGSLEHITAWGTNTLPYPLHVPILIASLRILFAELLPASKMIFSGYYLALLFFSYHALLRSGVWRPLAGLSTLLFATTPLLYQHATIAYANLALSYTLIAAVFLLVQALYSSGNTSGNKSAWLAGLLFVAAAWTRPEGLVLTWLGIALIYGLAYLHRRLVHLRQIAPVFIPMLVYTIFWVLLLGTIYNQALPNNDLVANAVGQILRGNFHLGEAYYILRSLVMNLLSPAIWGLLGFALLVLATLSLLQFSPGMHPSCWLPVVGLLYVALIVGMYYLTSFDTAHDTSWWVTSGLDRMLIPGIGLLWLGSVSALGLWRRG